MTGDQLPTSDDPFRFFNHEVKPAEGSVPLGLASTYLRFDRADGRRMLVSYEPETTVQSVQETLRKIGAPTTEEEIRKAIARLKKRAK